MKICFGYFCRLHFWRLNKELSPQMKSHVTDFRDGTFMRIFDLSYDVAVIQWIMSCHKNRMTTRVITLARNAIDNVRVNNAFSI